MSFLGIFARYFLLILSALFNLGIFYLIFTPIGLILRISGKDLLDKRFKEQQIQQQKQKEQNMILDEIEKEINKEKQDAKRIDDIASIVPTGKKLQELKNELIDEE